MDTIPSQGTPSGRHRRLHSDEFKANAVAAAVQPGVSLAAVAMSVGINANLLRRWVHQAEVMPTRASGPAATVAGGSATSSTFMAVTLPVPPAVPVDIRLELRRGTTTVVVTWPATAAAECAAWMRELLR